MAHPTSLPYTDTKPVGAADFYTAINATFRFVLDRFGREGLLRYWRQMGSQYYAPVGRRWKEGGLAAVADYWRGFFSAEPGAVFEVSQDAKEVCVTVKMCPAILHLRTQGREIMPMFCQHCYFVSDAMGEPAGVTVRVKGGNGNCVQHFSRRSDCSDAQRMEDIASAS